ncbi:MAG: amidohydrolase [Pyrinomonadaceae bacterium]
MKTRSILALAVSVLFGSIFSAAPTIKADGTTREQEVARAAEAMRDRLVAQRRDFHMHPELSNREVRTAGIVAARLKELGLEDIKVNVGKYGVTALLRGEKPGPVVAVRADMDALPITEVNDVPYKSQTPGVKHACGHDAHTTVELGVAEVLSKMRSQIHGTIKFIFQPAEEGAPAGEEGGAKFMIKEGALENPRPQAIFGLHTEPNLQVGSIGYHSGPAMASSDRVLLTVKGLSVHGALPYKGIDAIVVSAECILALQTIHSRRIDTQEPFVLTIGMINGGVRNNVIAGEVKMEGTLRAFSEDNRQKVIAAMRQTLDGITAANGATYDLQVVENAAGTSNDPALVDETLGTIRRVVGEKNVLPLRPLMPAEDFSYYQKVMPGFYYFLGVGNVKKGVTAQWHTPDFDIDEDSLVVGVKVMSNVLLDYLDRHAKDAPTSAAGGNPAARP